jgi:hypothetical protein
VIWLEPDRIARDTWLRPEGAANVTPLSITAPAANASTTRWPVRREMSAWALSVVACQLVLTNQNINLARRSSQRIAVSGAGRAG